MNREKAIRASAALLRDAGVAFFPLDLRQPRVRELVIHECVTLGLLFPMDSRQPRRSFTHQTGAAAGGSDNRNFRDASAGRSRRDPAVSFPVPDGTMTVLSQEEH